MADVTSPRSNSHPGLGEPWRTDADRMRAAVLLDHRNYSSEPVFCVRRSAGKHEKERIISFPTYYDRAVHRMHTLLLEAICEPLHDPHLYSFRRGRTVSDAAGRVVELLSDPGTGWAAVCDISSFFDSVSHEAVIESVPLCRDLLREALKAPRLLYGTDLVEVPDRGLPTGGSLSPVLADRVLDGLEAFITKGTGCGTVRWVDDILIAAPSKDAALRSAALVRRFLYPRGLRLNPEKSAVVPVSEGFEFLKYRFRAKGSGVHVEPSETAVEILLTDIERGTSREQDEDAVVIAANRILGGFARSYRSADLGRCARRIDRAVLDAVLSRLAALRGTAADAVVAIYIGEDRRGRFLRTGSGRRLARASDIVRVPFSTVPPERTYFIDRGWFASRSSKERISRVATDPLRRIWWSTDGRCGVCGKPIRVDDERDLVSRNGHRTYVHAICTDGDIDPSLILGDGIVSEPAWSPPAPAEEQMRPVELARLESPQPPRSDAIVFRTARGTVSKYQGLLDLIQKINYQSLDLSFKAVSDVVGGLASSAYTDRSWWFRTSRSSIGEALSAIDWQVDEVDMEGTTVRFCVMKTRCTLAERAYLQRHTAVDAERHVALRDARLEKAWYWRITRFLLDCDLDQIALTFGEFEEIVQHRLPERAYRDSRYWSERDCGSPLLAIEDGDFEKTRIDVDDRRMVLTRACCVSDPGREHVPKGGLQVKEHMKRRRPGTRLRCFYQVIALRHPAPLTTDSTPHGRHPHPADPVHAPKPRDAFFRHQPICIWRTLSRLCFPGDNWSPASGRGCSWTRPAASPGSHRVAPHLILRIPVQLSLPAVNDERRIQDA